MQERASQSRDTVCDPIPPRSEIRVRSDNPGPYVDLLGSRLRVGYYSICDGLNVIWIVYPDGQYGETTDREHLRNHFEVGWRSDEQDMYGVNRPKLQPLD